MKTSIISVALLLLITACGDDGVGNPKFSSFVTDGVNPIDGASIEIYPSIQNWINGDSPTKTYTTNAKGLVETNDQYTGAEFAYIEKGNLNNWPASVSESLTPDTAIPGRFNCNATLYNTFLQDFEAVNGKSFLLTDVTVNGSSIYSTVSACSKDNFIRLTKESKFIYSEGANICPGKTATSTHDVFVPVEKPIGTTPIHNFQTNWSEITNGLFVFAGFNQIQTQENVSGNLVVSTYTLQ
jgi:hypothetical protein